MSKVAIVTGGSSGIGLCTAQSLLAKGCKVYIFSRRPYTLAGASHVCVDVTDEKQVQEAVQQVLGREKRVDLVVNCAGFGISGAVEFTELADISNYARECFHKKGVKIIEAATPIVPIYTYDAFRTLEKSKRAYEEGVYVNSVLPPACAEGECLLRTSYMATLTRDLVEEATDILARVLDEDA